MDDRKSMKQSELIQIDLDKVLESKMGSKVRYVPRFLVNWLKRTICQDELNGMLQRFYPNTGAEFSRVALRDLEIKVDLKNPEKLPSYDNRRVIFVSNHPLGGLDGIALIALISDAYQTAEQKVNDEQCLRFVVNDLLMAVEPLGNVFLPINKHGKQSREAIEDINKAFEGDDPVLVFPAGLVSRMGKGGEIRDLEWHKMFVAKAAQFHRDVVPLYFSGENSKHFYKFARWRKRLGLKFNIEMIYLPQELVKAKGSEYEVTVGERIPWERFAEASDQLALAQEIKEITYSMKTK